MSEKLSVVCWKWVPVNGYRSHFTFEHVNTLQRMVERHLKMPHEFVCITDNWKEINSAVRVIPLWKDHASLQSPHGGYNPSCYRRLKLFSQEAAELVGPRMVSLDLDTVVVGDLDPLWDRSEDVVFWGDSSRTTPYNGSMWLLRAGSRTQVWDEFHPEVSPRLAKGKGFHGSDQAWMSYILPGEPRWTAEDGVLSYRCHIKQGGYRLPKGSRIVFFNGHTDPWSPVARRNCPWIDDYYR
ncbi:MAG: hypothetical protein HC793_00320 [Aquincola sp.]|nr:hypothetical protein [Aquincola sp.]